MKKVNVIGSIALIMAISIFVLIVGCQPAGTDQTIVAMVTDTGGLGDKSFNDGVYEGLLRAESNDDVDIRIVESNDQTDYIPNLSGFAEDGADLVFAVGFLMAEAVTEVAQNYPDTDFAGIDIFVDPSVAPSNLQGILFKEQESGYLAGVLAGLLTKEYAGISDKLNDDNVVGVVLGLLIPPVERFEVGFKAGVHKYNPEADVISIITESFTDTAKGKEAAIAMIDQGADIIFQVAGLTGAGSIAAAQERGVLAIGVDVDQSNLAPDTVVTSAVKRLDEAAYLTIKNTISDNFSSGNVALGISDGATGIAPFHQFDSIIPQAVKDIIDEEIAEMIAGNIVIPSSRAEAEQLGIDN